MRKYRLQRLWHQPNDKFIDDAKLALAIANQRARELQFGEVLPEHILLAILREPQSGQLAVVPISETLRRQLRENVQRKLRPGTGGNCAGKLPLSLASHSVLEQSVKESQLLGHQNRQRDFDRETSAESFVLKAAPDCPQQIEYSFRQAQEPLRQFWKSCRQCPNPRLLER